MARARRAQRRMATRKREDIKQVSARRAAQSRELDRQREREADRLERRLKRQQADDARRVAGADRAQAEREDETYERLSPDDRGYRPSNGDPLATGAARVSGKTASVARRGKTITKWQYEGGA